MPAIGVHHTETSNSSWDGPANEARLRNDESATYYRRAYAWRDGDEDGDKKAHYRFIHHSVSGDGTVGAANVTACRTGIAVLNGARGGTTVPASDKRGIYRHLAAHLRDADIEPPEAKFSANMLETATLHFVTHRVNRVKEITHDGRSFLVAPVVALKAGVVNGHLVPPEELAKFVEAWNGRPVPLGHPQRNGEHVSANSPDIWASETPGMFWNAFMDGDALKGEIWIDLAKAQTLGKQALEAVDRLRSNEPIEVSTGYFCDILDERGIWNGKPYDGVQTGIRPDHLALLVDGVGACSWHDGCGTPRVNEGEPMLRDETEQSVQTNDTELSDRISLVARAFRELNGASTEFDMELEIAAIFDEVLIAKDWGSKQSWAYDYSLDDDSVTFGEGRRVEIVYRDLDGGNEVVVANALTQEQKAESFFERLTNWFKTQQLSGVAPQEASMDRDELVAALVANEQCKFIQERLETFDDEELANLQAAFAVQEDSDEDVEPEPEPAVVEPEPVADEMPEWAKALESRIDAIASTVQANENKERDELVSELAANDACAFEAKELQAMTVNQLQKLRDSLRPRNYTGAAGVIERSGTGKGEKVLEMPKPLGWGKNGGDD